MKNESLNENEENSWLWHLRHALLSPKNEVAAKVIIKIKELEFRPGVNKCVSSVSKVIC